MRQIEVEMFNAFMERRNFCQSNTRVENTDEGYTFVYLHGNLIYEVAPNGSERFSLCGWNTNTTRSRLQALGVEIHNKKGVPHYKGQPVPTNGWVTIL